MRERLAKSSERIEVFLPREPKDVKGTLYKLDLFLNSNSNFTEIPPAWDQLHKEVARRVHPLSPTNNHPCPQGGSYLYIRLDKDIGFPQLVMAQWDPNKKEHSDTAAFGGSFMDDNPHRLEFIAPGKSLVTSVILLPNFISSSKQPETYYQPENGSGSIVSLAVLSVYAHTGQLERARRRIHDRVFRDYDEETPQDLSEAPATAIEILEEPYDNDYEFHLNLVDALLRLNRLRDNGLIKGKALLDALTVLDPENGPGLRGMQKEDEDIEIINSIKDELGKIQDDLDLQLTAREVQNLIDAILCQSIHVPTAEFLADRMLLEKKIKEQVEDKETFEKIIAGAIGAYIYKEWQRHAEKYNQILPWFLNDEVKSLRKKDNREIAKKRILGMLPVSQPKDVSDDISINIPDELFLGILSKYQTVIKRKYSVNITERIRAKLGFLKRRDPVEELIERLIENFL